MRRPRAIEPLTLVFAALVAVRAAQAEDESSLRARAKRLHQEAIVVDGHNDVTTWMLDYGFDLGMDGADPAKRRAKLYWVRGWLAADAAGRRAAHRYRSAPVTSGWRRRAVLLDFRR